MVPLFMKRVLFISSGGGHLEELLQLKSLFDSCEYLIVTEKTPTTTSFFDKFENIRFLKYGTKDHLLPYLFIFPYNWFLSKKIFKEFKPDFVITTGTHTAVPMCYIAHKAGKKVIYIETFANVNTPTKAGKMVYEIADKFIVQWPDMLKIYDKAECWGSIF